MCWIWALLRWIICKYFLPFCGLMLYFADFFLLCGLKFFSLSPICLLFLFLPTLLVPYSSHRQIQHYESCGLISFKAFYTFRSHKFLMHTELFFLHARVGQGLASFFCMQIFSFSTIISLSGNHFIPSMKALR